MCNPRVTGLANLAFLTPPSAPLLLEIGEKHNKAIGVEGVLCNSRGCSSCSDVMMVFSNLTAPRHGFRFDRSTGHDVQATVMGKEWYLFKIRPSVGRRLTDDDNNNCDRGELKMTGARHTHTQFQLGQ